MPSDPTADRDSLEQLVDEFAARCRRGEQPSVVEYTERYPEYTRQIEQLFPAVAMMERLRAEEASHREAAVRHGHSFVAPDRIGDFDIRREIGRGGMGVVYEAVQRSLARRVAVKVLPKHVLSGEKDRKRFHREAQTAAGLRHTAIVPVFGVGEQDGLHYYVMPLVPGVGLDEVIRELRAANEASETAASNKKTAAADCENVLQAAEKLIGEKFTIAGRRSSDWRPASVREDQHEPRWMTAARLGVQAAEALAYAHCQGTLHRDVKPGNLLVDAEGNACLADFGLARAVELADPAPGEEVVGTPRYMAPEQLRGRADARSDIYALGLTLYELLTLRPAMVDGRTRRRPVPPRSIDRAIPRDFEAIVSKCLAHEPWRRYSSAAELAADLRDLLDQRPVRARRVSRLERGWRWCRRNPALAAASLSAALFVVAFTASAVVGYLHARGAHEEISRALSQTEATSNVALEVLDGIYLQLAPERVWIPSGSDPVGQACACVGLRSAPPTSAEGLSYIQLQASEQTAALLGNLLSFYDQLAEQAGDDFRVRFQSAVATRRVGDIRQRLGQSDRAEREYVKAARKLDALRNTAAAGEQLCVELARVYNEIGNVRSARFEPASAYRAHEQALKTLEASDGAEAPSEEFRYELARTYFFLAGKYLRESVVGAESPAETASRRPAAFPSPHRQYRQTAIELLEQLVEESPEAADYRFLLALCHRPLVIGPMLERGPAASRGRQRALEILETLKEEYPQVADYRHELAATYAWVHVSLFPWQGRSLASPKAEEGLRKALDEAQWLTDHNPSSPYYGRSKALVLAKLAAVCEQTARPTEAADLFARALSTQAALVDACPDLPPHDRVLREFFRLRLAMARLASGGAQSPSSVRDILAQCIENLTPLAGQNDLQSELGEDRLASSSLEIAEDALRRLDGR